MYLFVSYLQASREALLKAAGSCFQSLKGNGRCNGRGERLMVKPEEKVSVQKEAEYISATLTEYMNERFVGIYFV